MSIRDLIRRPLEALPATASCAEAALLMRDQRVGSIAVSDGRKLLGIVTDRDLVMRVMATGRSAQAVSLSEVMSQNPVYLPADSSIDSALATMRELGVRRIPIVDTEGRLDGMLSMDDLVASLGKQLAVLAQAMGRVAQSEPGPLAAFHVREG
jgi:CBS domain-containing protein